ncbi:oxidoreductase C-terminal domain-containing protein [Mesorhizobium sp. CAU 1741]|uniref:oxidoreductase C-terminal domain-containing protein n=1 Tax=Mesorhizobium sp. CAU 1741 TaxID=3140366 RepID=UPI00325ACC47
MSMDADDHLATGNPVQNELAVHHFRQGTLVAIDIVNRPADHILDRRMIAAGYTPVKAFIYEYRVNEAFKRWMASVSPQADGTRSVE